jgi:hypothetical protein
MRLAFFQPDRAGNVGTALRIAVAAAVACSSFNARSAPPVGIKILATDMSPRISRCLIRREPEMVGRWLRTLPGSSWEARLVRGAEAGFAACFDHTAFFQNASRIPVYDTAGMRAALVRALLQARRDALPAAPPADSGQPWYPPEAGTDGPAILAADLGACLARKHWTAVLAIIRAVDPETERNMFFESRKARAARRREAAAVDSELAGMIPSIAGCVPAGAKLRIERPRLRTLVEEAAYHMTSGDRPAAGEGPPFNDR